jgi:DNA transposition AAA+ family ATPase
MAGIELYHLRRWRAGHYLGDVKKLEGKIETVLDREIEKNLLPKADPSFVETSVTRRAHNCCRLCHLQGEMGILYGAAGIGKSVSCHGYIDLYPDTILIESLPNYSASAVVKTLCSRLNLNEGLNLVESFRAVAQQLKDTGRLIILDEAELVSWRGLNIMRRLWDFTGCGMVFCGLPALLANIRVLHGEFQQLSSRIGVAVKLENIIESDAKALVQHWLPEAADMWPHFWKVAGANARRLSKLVKMSIHLAGVNDSEITKEIILKAAEVLIA